MGKQTNRDAYSKKNLLAGLDALPKSQLNARRAIAIAKYGPGCDVAARIQTLIKSREENRRNAERDKSEPLTSRLENGSVRG